MRQISLRKTLNPYRDLRGRRQAARCALTSQGDTDPAVGDAQRVLEVGSQSMDVKYSQK
jgi:hypothetical protein